jgi:HEPN domain-containing protein
MQVWGAQQLRIWICKCGEMKEVERWVKKAEKDLRAAKLNFKEGLYDVAAFLSHQGAEKALKALYILKFKRLWKIHDLEKLALTLRTDKEIIEISKELNPHYVETRYPVDVKYTKRVAGRALENAQEVIKWVKQKLKKL